MKTVTLPPIIGLSGKAGCGKDTLGREALRPLGYTQFALAWHMKNEAVGGFTEVVEHRFGGSHVNLIKPSYEEVHFNKPPAIRKYLQQRGTEDGWMKFGKDYWLRIADAWMRTLRENCGLKTFYITDVRFPHEVDWIEAQGGIVIRIVGRGGLEGEAANHLSETAVDDRYFPYTLNNDGLLLDSIERLQSMVIRAC